MARGAEEGCGPRPPVFGGRGRPAAGLTCGHYQRGSRPNGHVRVPGFAGSVIADSHQFPIHGNKTAGFLPAMLALLHYISDVCLRGSPAVTPRGHCQTDWVGGGLSSCELSPLGHGGGSVLFENVATVEMALVVEVVVDRGVNGGEFLQGLDISEPRHRSFETAGASFPPGC